MDACGSSSYIKNDNVYCSKCHKLLHQAMQPEGIDFGRNSSSKSCRNTGTRVRNSDFPKTFSLYKQKRAKKIIKDTQKEYPYIPQSVIDLMRRVLIDLMGQFYVHTDKKQRMMMLFMFRKLMFTKTAFLNEHVFYFDKLFYAKIGMNAGGRTIHERALYANARKRGMMMLEVADIDLGNEYYVPTFSEICAFFEKKYIQKYIIRYRHAPSRYEPSPTRLYNSIYHSDLNITRHMQVAIYVYSCIQQLIDINWWETNPITAQIIADASRRLEHYLKKSELPGIKAVRTATDRVVRSARELTPLQLQVPHRLFYIKKLLGDDEFDKACILYAS